MNIKLLHDKQLIKLMKIDRDTKIQYILKTILEIFNRWDNITLYITTDKEVLEK